FQTGLAPRRGGGKFQPCLTDEEVRLELDGAFQRVATGGGNFAGLPDASQAWAKGGFHEQMVQMLQHISLRRLLTAPPGRDGWQFELLAEEVPTESGQEGKEGGALQQSAAERVGNGDVAGAKGFEQTGHAQRRAVAQL